MYMYMYDTKYPKFCENGDKRDKTNKAEKYFLSKSRSTVA